jgi:hypothetical protein
VDGQGSAFGSARFADGPPPGVADGGVTLVILSLLVMTLVLVAYRLGRKDGNAAAVRYFSVQRQIGAREQKWPPLFRDDPESLPR